MKGPGYRHDLDVRRTWRCPACQRQRRLPGDVTVVRCGCQPPGTWMELIGDRTVPPRPPVLVTLPEQSVESFQLTEEELARPVQGRIRRRSFSRIPQEQAPDVAGQTPPTDPSGPLPRRPRPERRPKPEKRPLSELEHFGEPRTSLASEPGPLPPVQPPPPNNEPDGFGTGLD